MKVTKYDDLVVWKRSMELIRLVYLATRPFPDEERYGLASQMRRSAVSVASNIAEGQGRFSTAEFLRHISFAYGSLIEIETQIRIAGMLELVSADRLHSLLSKTREVGRMLNGLRKSLVSRSRQMQHCPPTISVDH